MEKKSILMILVILIIVVGGVFAYTQFFNSTSQEQVQVGNGTFNLPEGFKQTDSTKPDFINITNGYDTFFIKECGSENITKYVKSYERQATNNNKTVHVKNFTVNNDTVYKATIDESKVIHYWFNYNGKVYTCYSWSDENNMDKILNNLITSQN